MPKLEISIMKLNAIINDLLDDECDTCDTIGICWSCGELMDYCEPDAEDYECEVCGKLNGQGLLACLMRIMDDAREIS